MARRPGKVILSRVRRLIDIPHILVLHCNHRGVARLLPVIPRRGLMTLRV